MAESASNTYTVELLANVTMGDVTVSTAFGRSLNKVLDKWRNPRPQLSKPYPIPKGEDVFAVMFEIHRAPPRPDNYNISLYVIIRENGLPMGVPMYRDVTSGGSDSPPEAFYLHWPSLLATR
jgi:hypothetical protein